MIGAIDKLEEEEGDKDKLDENVVKDGLDKIYMYVFKLCLLYINSIKILLFLILYFKKY